MPDNTRSSELLDEALVDMVDKHFPKGECKERGAAMVLLSEFLRWHASKVEEARKADSHHWDSETFAPITVCIRCATTFQIRGNKPCKGKMAKVALREPEALQSKEGNSNV